MAEYILHAYFSYASLQRATASVGSCYGEFVISGKAQVTGLWSYCSTNYDENKRYFRPFSQKQSILYMNFVHSKPSAKLSDRRASVEGNL